MGEVPADTGPRGAGFDPSADPTADLRPSPLAGCAFRPRRSPLVIAHTWARCRGNVTAVAAEFNGKIALDIRDSQPDWGPYAAPTAPENAPNVLYVVWDDVGIATWDCFGGLVDMPAMTRIAERGVRLTQFHTTALCSPTRASLLTGRNATSVGTTPR